MDRDFEVIAVMPRQAFELVSLHPIGSSKEMGVHDRALQLRVPKGTKVKKGDRFRVSAEPIVEVEVVEEPPTDTVDVGDDHGIDYSV